MLLIGKMSTGLLLQCILGIVSCFFLQEISAQSNGDQIQVKLTVRDFLPSWCMPESVYNAVWNTNDAGHALTQSNIQLNQNTKSCPFFQDIRDGTISGHPLMEHHTGDEINPTVVKDLLVPASSGIPKPVHCETPPNSCAQDIVTEGKEFFDLLFNDDFKYSRRSGFKLTLRFDAGRNKFRYNSQLQAHEENSQFSSDGVIDLDTTQPFINRDNLDGSGQVPERFFGPLDRFHQTSSNFEVTESDDISSIPAWPQTRRSSSPGLGSNNIRVARTQNHKFWFTTELHETFQYKGGETFNFNVQDVAWVFINGKKAVDIIDGTQFASGPAAATIDLDTENVNRNLGLKIGGIYNIDAFQIEKHTGGSTWLFETQLADVCNVVRSGSVALSQKNGINAQLGDFKFSRNVVVEGSGANTEFRLTTAGTNFASGYVFPVEEFNVGTGFTAEFTFRVSGNSDGGFAFVIHNRADGLKNFPLSSAAQLGFKGVERSVAIAFDLCADRDSSNSCAEQEIRLHFNGNINGVNSPSLATRRVHDKILQSLKDGQEHRVRVEYLERPDHLNVFLDDSLFLRQEKFKIDNYVGGRDAFIGFTASHDIIGSNIRISDFVVNTVVIDTLNTDPIDLVQNAEPKRVVADGKEKKGFSIQSRDLCDNEIQFGGDKERVSGKFVEILTETNPSYFNGSKTPSIIDADVLDNGDGSYTIALGTTIVSEFALFAAYGDDCDYNIQLVDSASDPSVKVAQLSPAGGGDPKCFFADVARAIITDPVPPEDEEEDVFLGIPKSKLLAVALGGAGVLGCCGVAGIMFWKYRNKWQREKVFIEPGARARLEKETTFDPNNERSVLARMFQSVAALLLRERAKAGAVNEDETIDHYRKEQQALQDDIRRKRNNIDNMSNRKGPKKIPPRANKPKMEF